MGDPSYANKEQLPTLAEDVSSCIQELLDIVEELKGLPAVVGSTE